MVTTYFCGFVLVRGTVIHWSYVAFSLLRLLRLANCLLSPAVCRLLIIPFLFLLVLIKLIYRTNSLSMPCSLCMFRGPLFFLYSPLRSLVDYQYRLSSFSLPRLRSSDGENLSIVEAHTPWRPVHPFRTLSLSTSRLSSHHLHVLQGSPGWI